METNDVRCRCRDGARSIFGCHPAVMAPWYHNHPSPIENQQMDRSLPPSLISLHANTHTLSLSLLVGSFIHSFIFTTLDSTKLLCVYYLVGYNNWLMGTTVPLFLTLYPFSTFYLEINILDISYTNKCETSSFFDCAPSESHKNLQKCGRGANQYVTRQTKKEESSYHNRAPSKVRYGISYHIRVKYIIGYIRTK